MKEQEGEELQVAPAAALLDSPFLNSSLPGCEKLVYLWTHRVTHTDVVSTRTTSTSLGSAKLNKRPKEDPLLTAAKRELKPLFQSVYRSPLEHTNSTSSNQFEHERLNQRLLDEQRDFMSRLQLTRAT
ncbi:unnamed protein product, partial [Chrysoparadoxa australica]